ncbi:MAG TPA: hypothetical protein VFU60_13980 [Ktedonobacterales bacterium]|nr:hypothetical protein [Ktedonobacterales bacterium]
MAQPRKAATPPAAQTKSSGKASGKAPGNAQGKGNGQFQRAASTAPASGAGGSAGALRATLAIFALFLLIGVVPSALAGEAFGVWRLPSTGGPLISLPWSLSYETPLPTPSAMLANATLRVVTTPGGSQVVATLQPGFSVRVARYATTAGERWAQIQWSGPTHATGGSGWVSASGLIAASGASQSGQARDIGDLGALSPAFGQAIGALGPGFNATLYFPAAGATYASASVDQPESLGGQIVPVLLTALYAKGIVAAQPNASNGPPAIARDLAADNAQALTFDYELLGDAAGLDSFMAQHHLTGFQFVAHQPTQAKGTARGLVLFYAALASDALTSAHDAGEITTLLANANAKPASAVTPQTFIGSGALTVTTASASASGDVVAIAAGVAQPASGPQVIVIAIAHGATSAATQQALQTFFQQLAPLAQE